MTTRWAKAGGPALSWDCSHCRTKVGIAHAPAVMANIALPRREPYHLVLCLTCHDVLVVGRGQKKKRAA